MPRIRTIKPEFWSHEELSELPPEAHMLAAALLNYADDEGLFNANPKLVKAACSPLRDDSMSIQCALNELSRICYVRLGEGSDGKRYGKICKFKQHQVISRPSKSKIAEISITWDDSLNTHGGLTEHSSWEGKGTGKGKEQGKEQGREFSADARAAIEYLNEVCGTKYQKTERNLGFASARLGEGNTLDDIKAVVRFKSDEWKDQSKMRQYLRPETLLGASKFPGYLAAAKSEGQSPHNGFDNREYTDHLPDWAQED